MRGSPAPVVSAGKSRGWRNPAHTNKMTPLPFGDGCLAVDPTSFKWRTWLSPTGHDTSFLHVSGNNEVCPTGPDPIHVVGVQNVAPDACLHCSVDRITTPRAPNCVSKDHTSYAGRTYFCIRVTRGRKGIEDFVAGGLRVVLKPIIETLILKY